MNDTVILAEATKTGSHNICPYTIKRKSEYNGSMMKTIREFLEEQINEQLIQGCCQWPQDWRGTFQGEASSCGAEGSDFLPGVHDRRDEGLS